MEVSKAKRIRLLNSVLQQVNNQVWDTIPLDLIFEKLQDKGFLPIDLDGREWCGMICEPDGQTYMDLCDLETGAGYSYIRYEGETIDAVRMPMNLRPFSHTKEAQEKQIWNVEQVECTKAEFETFHAMGCQLIDIYDESTMHFDHCHRCLSLSWHKREAGGYEILAFVA